MRGPKPQSKSRKKLTGNRGCRKVLNNPEPQPAKTFRCPAWIGKHGKDLWKKTAPELLRLGVLTELDRSGFESMCMAYHIMRMAEKELARDGLTARDDRGGIKKHPAAAIHKANADLYSKFAELFGLSPISRQRLDVKVDEQNMAEEELFLRSGHE